MVANDNTVRFRPHLIDIRGPATAQARPTPGSRSTSASRVAGHSDADLTPMPVISPDQASAFGQEPRDLPATCQPSLAAASGQYLMTKSLNRYRDGVSELRQPVGLRPEGG